MAMKRGTISVLFISLLLAAVGCATSLKEYQAKSPDEEAIKGALLRWETSWNKGDPAGVLSVISEDAQIMYGSDKAVASKQDYAGIIPERMKANPTVTVGLPKIKLAGEKAVAATSLSTRGRSMPVTFEFAKMSGQWLVTRFAY
jgi:hypothetical protein